MSELANQTPVQIDTELSRIYNEAARIEAKRDQALRTAEFYDKQEAKYGTYKGQAGKQLDIAADLGVKLFALGEEEKPLVAEFNRRGGWTRAFLVSNSNGHVHRSTHCSTCFLTTEYYWVTALSGHDETEIVEQAGERACTVCYPSAPVEVLSRPTRLFTPSEQEKAKAREERAQKAAQRDAAKVIDPMTGEELYKTERGASNAALSELDSLAWYGFTHPSYLTWVKTIKAVVRALAVKQGRTEREVAQELVAKAEKKAKKEGSKHSLANVVEMVS